MTPTPGSNAVAAKPLPPLPDLPGAPSSTTGNAPPDFLSSILSGIAPIKLAVDSIRSACQQIVQSGAVPGAEQVCGQIVALASSLMPMAAQNLMQPQSGMTGGAAPSPAGGGGIGAMPPPPNGPQPILGGQ